MYPGLIFVLLASFFVVKDLIIIFPGDLPEDIPSLAVPALLLLNAQEAIVVVRIEGAGLARQYHVLQPWRSP